MKAFIEQATFEMVKNLSKGENKDDWRSMLASDVGIYSTLLRLKALWFISLLLFLKKEKKSCLLFNFQFALFLKMPCFVDDFTVGHFISNGLRL